MLGTQHKFVENATIFYASVARVTNVSHASLMESVPQGLHRLRSLPAKLFILEL